MEKLQSLLITGAIVRNDKEASKIFDKSVSDMVAGRRRLDSVANEQIQLLKFRKFEADNTTNVE